MEARKYDLQKELKIFFADDDKDDFDFFRTALEKVHSKASLKVAFNGKELMEFLKKAQQNKDLPSIIILDLNMPILDGFNTLKEISQSESFKKIPVYILSTVMNLNDKMKQISDHIAGYYAKPIEEIKLQRIIQEILINEGFLRKDLN